ncbi:PREDICTED: uncharacterized protein LOC105316787 [Amphimedon queenslandica]|uniref:DUF3504 domain-containing protein n=1 Tax=Amphimedon queenslandica TaxID=400682 RepID=A0AAN0IVQ5_AMPQE|nr:PREDICTED: uncharacterized protein LOC105316787 [Amphimedon queenslandica]|eukprot:XP_011410282.1 PREDICTED: uncharacterized protein LOC105316787 [Amphimedon queenslandica]
MKRAALEQISSVPLKRPLVLGPNRRFLPPITTEEATEKAKGAVPANMKLANKWALRTFQSWVSFRNSMSEEKVPEDLLACKNSEVVCYWLCRFVSEARKENREPYPSATIRSLLAVYQRILQDNKLDYHLFSKNDFRFRELQNTIDSVCVTLRKEGVGAIRKAAAVITKEDEQLLWSSGVMGTDSPWPLLHAVFYTVGLSFTLRGGQEHRDLTIEQFRRFPQDHGVYNEDTYYQYVEHGSKSYQGRLSDLDSNKVSYIYAQPDYSIPGMCPLSSTID